MKVKKKTEKAPNTSGNRDISTDPIERRKIKLKDQIRELRALISQTEHNLEITKFCALTNTHEILQRKEDNVTVKSVPNLFATFANEVYKLAGFYCAKLTKTEFVFNFTSSIENEKIETFSVQILNNNGKGSVGKWVMPMSIVIQQILSQTPIDNISAVVPFLRNCKRHIDCYTERKKEFLELKDYTSDMRNIEISANMGFNLITLHLLKVNNNSTNSFVNLTISLSYKSDETRSSTINVDSSTEKGSSQIDANDIKSYTKFFKRHSMKESFQRMIETKNSMFAWVVERDTNLGLDLSNTSESENDSMIEKAKRRRKKITRKRRKNLDVQKRWKQRLAEKTIVRHVTRKNTIDENISESNDEPDESNDISPERKKMKNSTSNPVNPIIPENTKRVLRQSTLNFRRNSTKPSIVENQENADVNIKKNDKKANSIFHGKISENTVKKSKILVPKENKIEQKISQKPSLPKGILLTKKILKVNLAMTSTPLHNTAKSRVKFANSSETEISPITR